MIDYCPPVEYVSYIDEPSAVADDIPEIEGLDYSQSLPSYFEPTITTYDVVFDVPESFEGLKSCYYAISADSSTYPPQSYLSLNFLFGNRYMFYWIKCLVDSNGNDVSEESDFYLYCRGDSAGFVYRVVQTVPLGAANTQFYLYRPSVQYPLIDIEGEDVVFLYNLGKQLVKIVEPLNELLTFDIGGYNLITLVASSAFVVYLGWTFIKWVIPS